MVQDKKSGTIEDIEVLHQAFDDLTDVGQPMTYLVSSVRYDPLASLTSIRAADLTRTFAHIVDPGNGPVAAYTKPPQ